jgi:hypothetical protein
MEMTGSSGKIQVSQDIYHHLSNPPSSTANFQ